VKAETAFPADGGTPCTVPETPPGKLDFSWLRALKKKHKKIAAASFKARRIANRKAAREYKGGGRFWKPPYNKTRPVVEATARIEKLRVELWEATPASRRTESFGRQMITMAASDAMAAAFGGVATTWVELDTLTEIELEEMLAYEKAVGRPSVR
jgi:hypothetical protein